MTGDAFLQKLKELQVEIQHLLDYVHLLETGMSAYEARETVWPSPQAEGG